MKYKFRYLDGLDPIKQSSALTLGSIVHSAFDMYYNQFPTEDVIRYIKNAVQMQVEGLHPEEQEDIQIVQYISLGMFINYPINLIVFKEIKPELEFRVQLFDDVWFTGTVDGLVMDQNNKLWVREVKTTSQAFPQFEKRARTTAQGSGYIWAMRKLGFPVEGVMYDYIKKPLLRKGTNDTVDSFGTRICADYHMRPDFYFKRHFSYRSNEQMELFEQDLIGVAKEIQYRCKNNAWYRNPDQCWNFNSECPYMKICFQKNPDPLTIQLYYKQTNKQNKGENNVKRTGETAGRTEEAD